MHNSWLFLGTESFNSNPFLPAQLGPLASLLSINPLLSTQLSNLTTTGLPNFGGTGMPNLPKYPLNPFLFMQRPKVQVILFVNILDIKIIFMVMTFNKTNFNPKIFNLLSFCSTKALICFFSVLWYFCYLFTFFFILLIYVY